jgi:nitrogen regulatory protein P-II 1
MEWRKITAIFQGYKLEDVKRRLGEVGVHGISVTRVQGHGEYKNFFGRDWSVTHARIEVFSTVSKAEEIAQAIMDAASTGSAGDGIVAILPVERIYRIRSKAEVRSGEI